MDTKEFKKMFDLIAKNHEFLKNFGGWFKESKECIVVLDLQKSNYSSFYYLNIKVYIQGFADNIYTKNKYLVKNGIGTVSTRSPKEYDSAFDLQNSLNDVEREYLLKKLFIKYIDPFTNNTLSRSGIKELAEADEILLQPAVREYLYSNGES